MKFHGIIWYFPVVAVGYAATGLFNLTRRSEVRKVDCSTCAYYDLALGIKPVCKLWLVGFDKRGYEPCDEYKERKEKIK